MPLRINRITAVYLQERCGFPDPDFDLLWEQVRRDLMKTRNRIGLEGSSRNRKEYTAWLDRYVDSGIGMKYWGPGTKRMWDFGIDRVEIRDYLRTLLTYVSGILRRIPRGPRVNFETDEDGPTEHEDSSTEDEDIAPPPMAATGENLTPKDSTEKTIMNHISDGCTETCNIQYHGFEKTRWAPQYVDPRLSLPWPMEDPLGEREDAAHKEWLMMMATPLIDPRAYISEDVEPVVFSNEDGHNC